MFIDLVPKTKMRKDIINMVDMHMHTVYSDGDKTVEEILKMCDHTLLKQDATWEDIRQLCDDAVKYKTASVCIPPCYVKEAKE